MITAIRFVGKIRNRVGASTAAAVLALSLSGCAGWRQHEEGFRDNELSKTALKARSDKAEADKDQKDKQAKDVDYSSFSEKGRQIERDLAPR